MHSYLLSMAVLISLASVQTPPAAPPPKQPIGKPGGTPGREAAKEAPDRPHDSVTVTGCVRTASSQTAESGSAGATASSPSGPITYVLVQDPDSSASGSGTSGSVAKMGTSASAATRRIRLEGGRDLNQNVGHYVQITGVLTDVPEGTAVTGSDAKASAASGTAGDATSAKDGKTPTLRVTSMRMMASGCPQ